MSEQDQDGRAVQDAERARLDEGLCALGFPAGGGRRGGGFRLKAAVREARTDRSFDFGEEWQRYREEADRPDPAEPPPRRSASTRENEPRLLSFTAADLGTVGAGRTRRSAGGPGTGRRRSRHFQSARLSGAARRADLRGLIERLALGTAPALPAPEPARQPTAQARAEHSASPDPHDLADRLSRIEAALAALVPAAVPDPEPEPAGRRRLNRPSPDRRPTAGPSGDRAMTASSTGGAPRRRTARALSIAGALAGAAVLAACQTTSPTLFRHSRVAQPAARSTRPHRVPMGRSTGSRAGAAHLAGDLSADGAGQ